MRSTTPLTLVEAVRGIAHPLVGSTRDYDPLMNLVGDARFAKACEDEVISQLVELQTRASDLPLHVHRGHFIVEPARPPHGRDA